MDHSVARIGFADSGKIGATHPSISLLLHAGRIRFLAVLAPYPHRAFGE
ncbi:hypothetical protein MTYM_00279 [Methylococcales bacterium]|nr:hypothetical protein MTYM_00279 [Methylococcales bacterium]